jgi:hypothetical protein
VSWGVQVLIEGLLATKCPIALVTLKDVSQGIQVLLQCALAAEVDHKVDSTWPFRSTVASALSSKLGY